MRDLALNEEVAALRGRIRLLENRLALTESVGDKIIADLVDVMLLKNALKEACDIAERLYTGGVMPGYHEASERRIAELRAFADEIRKDVQ